MFFLILCASSGRWQLSLFQYLWFVVVVAFFLLLSLLSIVVCCFVVVVFYLFGGGGGGGGFFFLGWVGGVEDILFYYKIIKWSGQAP